MASELFREFVEVCYGGNQRRAAAALNVSPSQVCKIIGGDRNVSPALAQRVEEVSDGRYAKEALIWPDAANDSTSTDS
jgi:DNA-binding transcriptional regulator YdaS (Cro superfamily)